MAKKLTAEKLVETMEVAQVVAETVKKRKPSKVEPTNTFEEPEVEEPEPPPSLESVVRRSTPEEQRIYATSPVVLLSMTEAVNMLFDSRFFLDGYLKKLIAQALRNGDYFEVIREGTYMAEYRMASKQDVIDLATQGIRQTTMKKAVAINIARRSGAGAEVIHEDGTKTVRPPRQAKAPTLRKARAGVEFVFNLPTGKALENRLANMPKQARLLMEIVVEAGQGQATLNGEALDQVLQAGGPGKGIEAKIVPLLLQRFKAFIRDGVYKGLVERKDNS